MYHEELMLDIMHKQGSLHLSTRSIHETSGVHAVVGYGRALRNFSYDVKKRIR